MCNRYYTNGQKRDDFMDSFEMTKSVVKLYFKLAELEKEKKQRSKEYKEIMDLLKYALAREKENKNSINKQVARTYYYNMAAKQPHQNYFVTLEPDMLAAIRFANHVDDEYLYTLDGIVLKEKYQKLQKNLDVKFYNLIHYCLKHVKLSKEERDSLITFQYGLLATSTPVEENIFIGECFLPFGNTSMNYEELQMGSVFIYKKVEELLNHLMRLTDSEITDQTLPMILYVKSCFPMLQPLVIGGILTELRNSLGLIKLYGDVTGKSRDKMCTLLSYLLESGLTKNKKIIA